MSTASNAAPMTRAETTTLVLLTLSQVALFLIPLIVLGKAIGWPASLRLPAAEMLPLIAAKAIAVQIGYWGYLLTAVAMVPFVIALRRYAVAHGAGGMLADTMAALGIAAAVLKTLGIVRWLIAMPTLAGLHGNAADPLTRAVIEMNYVALNSYAGSVGELLGVQLFSGVWLVLLGLIFLRTGLRLNAMASLTLGLGFAFTALRTLLPSFDLLGTIVPPIALLWLLGLAVTFWRIR
jgi:hypothetical protein